MERLHVLLREGTGIFRAKEFAGCEWLTDPKKVAVADVLRVHEWSYVKKVSELCHAVPPRDEAIGHLDGDTAISHGSFAAALHAAGCVTEAIDAVCEGRASNAFCAVRPPGHHAGPTGVVTCGNDSCGSHGFCLLNNVAVGAAYAVHVHRHRGINRVAILDFDAHHGNGTEAILESVLPANVKYTFNTPLSEGSMTFPTYRPWLDEDDPNRIFFGCVHGYGRKAPGSDAWFYPGSGCTCDTRPGVLQAALDNSGAAKSGGEGEEVGEERDEFESTKGSEVPSSLGPHVINVGIPGPGKRPNTWRRAWRDRILPAVDAFKPDLIIVSAGFDAHHRDEINYGYMGLREADYQWLTTQMVHLANKCCEGRLVSVLEGGYRVQGGIVSAFGRSVGAHVRALVAPTWEEYDPAVPQWEREREAEAKARKEREAEALTLALTLNPKP